MLHPSPELTKDKLDQLYKQLRVVQDSIPFDGMVVHPTQLTYCMDRMRSLMLFTQMSKPIPYLEGDALQGLRFAENEHLPTDVALLTKGTEIVGIWYLERDQWLKIKPIDVLFV